MSRRALQHKCQAAGVHARDCLRFVQCLQCVLLADQLRWDPAASLPVGDARTVRHIMARAGLDVGRRPAVDEFVVRQRFVTSESFVRALLAELMSIS